jgi:hypothetical protein
MADSLPNAIPLPEYPRPQFARANWLNLNGEWEFCIDDGNQGLFRPLFRRLFHRGDHCATRPDGSRPGLDGILRIRGLQWL